MLRIACREWTTLPGCAANAVQRSTGLRRNALAALAVAALLWVLGRLVSGRPLYLLAYGTTLIVALAWLLPRRGLGLRAQRRVERFRACEGEIVDVRVTLTARRTLATVVVEERIPHALGQSVTRALAAVPRGETVERYSLHCWRRGAYQIGPLVARFGDPVGLVTREEVLAGPVELLVHPLVGALRDSPEARRFEEPPQRPLVSRSWPTGMEFHGMREGRPGDGVRRIVWRAVARTGRIMVREAEQGITDRVTLILNSWNQAYPLEDYSTGFEAAVRVVASLAVGHLDEGFLVAVEAGGGPIAPEPLRGRTARVTMLDALARVERGDEPMTAALTRRARRPRGSDHHVVVTPRLDRADAAALRPLVAVGASVLVVVVKDGDRCEEAAHNAAALGCQVVEAAVRGAAAGRVLDELGGGRRPVPA